MDLSERAVGAAPGPHARHPWERARAAFVVERLRTMGLRPGDAVLDVGAGDAWLAASVQEALGVAVTCWDVHYQDDDLARVAALGLRPTRTLPDGPFHAALLLDLLEHVEDDAALLASVVARLRPGGRMLITVPAWPALFSAHDRALHHLRRYTPAALRARLLGAGLLVDESGGLFHALLAPRALAVLAERLGLAHWGEASELPGWRVAGWRGGAGVSDALVRALRAEQRLSLLSARLRLDVPGLSAWAVCTRPLWQSASP